MDYCILREYSTALCMYIYLSIDPQVEDLRTELMKMRKEKAELQSSQLEASRHVTQSRANDIHGEMGRGRPHWSGNEYMTGWTKRGHECFTISISENSLKYSNDMSLHLYMRILIQTFDIVHILTYLNTCIPSEDIDSNEYWHQIDLRPGDMQHVQCNFQGLGLVFPYLIRDMVWMYP